MTIQSRTYGYLVITLMGFMAVACQATVITTAHQPGQLDIRSAGEHSLRVTLRPLSDEKSLPFSPAVAERPYPDPVISLRQIDHPVTKQIGHLHVEIRPDPLEVIVTNDQNQPVQTLIFQKDGSLGFKIDDAPILGMGEGGPLPGRNWRQQPVEFDRRGREYAMRPRWQDDAYGSRNPVGLMIGTDGWALFVATPWGQIDLRAKTHGTFTPWQPPDRPTLTGDQNQRTRQQRRYTAAIQGRPPRDSIVPGVYDLFVFDAHHPARFMQDLSDITGPAVLPPQWALGYMQSHRTLQDDNQMIDIVKTFRAKHLPLDAVIYLGTGFCPRGWNTKQPSFDFNPEVFTHHTPTEVIQSLHDLHTKVVLHIVPWQRDRLPTLHGTIPPQKGEIVDASHILTYWQQHLGLVKAGVDGWWPDEGDWFNLFERVKRHQMYYQGPLSAQPNTRPWSLHRNGYLGVARWGGWVWSGDTQSSWKTLETQIADGINHSLSLSPFWGSDIGGFYPNKELTGELYVRWFQFGAFCPSFRSHGRTWWTRLPWGWGLKDMGPRENRSNPDVTELNNPAIEPICRQYEDLRYQLMPYTYTLAWQARTTGMPLMRALWLQYPNDPHVRDLANEYLWGRDLLIAPVYKPGAQTREVYLPKGTWIDWWTLQTQTGGQTVSRQVNLSKMPIYVRAGAIIPFDPIRQYTAQPVDEPTTLKIFTGADGRFTLYEDDGISLEYLQGHYTETKITWNDHLRQLTLEPIHSQETSPRPFKIELLPAGITQNITYTGKLLKISLNQKDAQNQ